MIRKLNDHRERSNPGECGARHDPIAAVGSLITRAKISSVGRSWSPWRTGARGLTRRGFPRPADPISCARMPVPASGWDHERQSERPGTEVERIGGDLCSPGPPIAVRRNPLGELPSRLAREIACGLLLSDRSNALVSGGRLNGRPGRTAILPRDLTASRRPTQKAAGDSRCHRGVAAHVHMGSCVGVQSCEPRERVNDLQRHRLRAGFDELHIGRCLRQLNEIGPGHLRDTTSCAFDRSDN